MSNILIDRGNKANESRKHLLVVIFDSWKRF